MPRKKSAHALTDIQKRRIKAIRTERLDRWESKRQKNLATLSAGSLGKTRDGLVIAHFGSHVEVEDAQGKRYPCAVRESVAENPVCGDRVLWQQAPNGQGVVTDLQPRSSVLRRPGPHERLQTFAANVDQMVITTTAVYPNPHLLDRYLVAASSARVKPLLAINKRDLLKESQSLDQVLAPYRQIGLPVLELSVLHPQGLSLLEQALRGKTSIFVGQSGVGKSSLIAQWISDPLLRVGSVNPETGKGRHTTSVARLYGLSCGGRLIDSPGVRAFNLHGVTPDEIPWHFPEIQPLLGGCRFPNCRHRQEPGCLVLEALAAGTIHPERLASLHRIVAMLAKERV
ncbi:MAG: ribosome small subunit-dependent GTPase A [Magnetococcales bacterium]|nr:ribosome small subunit-dependent GTPase A [Magnetococcales bacterium]